MMNIMMGVHFLMIELFMMSYIIFQLLFFGHFVQDIYLTFGFLSIITL